MFPLDLLTGPLMKAASSLKKLPPQQITKPPGADQALGGMFGKAGKILQPVSTGGAEGFPNVPPTAPPVSKPLPIAPRVASRFEPNRTLQQGLNDMEANAKSAEGVPLTSLSFDPLANREPAVKMAENPKVEDVPIPALPGRTGGPRPFDANTKAEFDYVMSKIPRDAAGNERKPTFGERFKSSLLPALLGTVQGVNSPAGQRNPLAGAIGGAAAGFGGGMIDPISARQYEWNQMYKPEMDTQEQRQEEKASRERKAAEEKRRDNESLVNMEARRLEIETQKAKREGLDRPQEASWGTYDPITGQPVYVRPQSSPAAPAPRRYNVNGTLVDETGKVVFKGDPKVKEMSLGEAEAAEAATEGTIEQIAQDSLQGRLESLKDRLAPHERAVIEGSADESLSPEEKAAAMRRWQQIQDRELTGIRRQVTEERKMKAQKRRTGGQPGAQSAVTNPAPPSPGKTAKLSDLKNLLR